MLKEHEIFVIPDQNKRHKFEWEVNWNLEDEKTNQCKVIKMSCPDGKVIYVKREHLLAILFSIGQPEDQMKMIPQRLTKTRRYETLVGVKANKDIARGEMVNFRVSIPLPAVEDEVIGNTNN